MASKQFLTNKLLVIESKHQAYFKINNISILDAVKIIGGFTASVHVINNSIPYDIRYDIESLFWRE